MLYNVKVNTIEEIMNTLTLVNLIMLSLTVLCFCYHLLLVFLNFVKKPKKYPDAKAKKYAILVPAHNEESVIGPLLDSLNAQDYPKDMLDVYVVADNCTDNTANVARQKGAYVYERQNEKLKTKSAALDDILHHIWDTVGKGVYYGYFIFDADNVVNKNFVKEINKVISSGKRIAVGYRNYKSKFSTWVSYCYNMYWLREAVQINRARNMLNGSATINGTGYCMTEDILLADDGFNTTTLTEDGEMTFRWITRGEKIAFCDDAILYDEQPTKFAVSFKQRARWAKGSIQCYFKFFWKLLKGCFKKQSAISCLDQLCYIFLPIIFSVISLILNIAFGLPMLLNNQLNVSTLLVSAGIGLAVAFIYTTLMPIFAIITERKRIKDSIPKCLLYSLTYPIFMITYAIILIYALFAKVGWTPIKHTEIVSIDDVEK